MQTPLSKRPVLARGAAAKPANDGSVPAAAPREATMPDSGWHESSYDLMRGLEVIECEWPETTSDARFLD